MNRQACDSSVRLVVGLSRRVALVICVLACIAGSVRAQGLQLPEPPLPVDPRPIAQLLSDGDRVMLAEAHGPKKIIEAYLKISDAHLQSAFDSIKVNDNNTSERELDIYNKAVAEATRDTSALTEGKRTVSKKVEQTLFRQIKTLESIDRLFPSEREAFPDAALKHARQLRVQALNQAFASGEILKDPDEEKKPDEHPPAKAPEKDSRPEPPLALRKRLLEERFRFAVLRSDRGARLDAALLASRSSQMPGDYLTEEEDNQVREAQAADQRVKVFVRIADRRIRAITGGPVAPSTTEKKGKKKTEEEEHDWGAVPIVSRTELLRHYARAISECMSKLEDAYERNPKSSLLPKALTILRDSTEKHLQTLRALELEMKTDKELAALRDAIEQAETANKGARDGLKASGERKQTE